MFRQDVVVHDGPFRTGDGRGAAAFDDADGGAGDGQLDLARPVALHRCRADHEIRPAGRGMAKRHDRLPRLAEPHVIRQDGAAAAEQEGDAFDLVREEPVTERDGLPVGAVRVVRRQAEQLRERCRLRVELFAVGGIGRRGFIGLSFRCVPRGGTKSVRSRMAPGVAWPAGPPWRLPCGKQDDGLACGSRSRSSRRTLHAGSGTCAAWFRAENEKSPPTVSRGLSQRLRWFFGPVYSRLHGPSNRNSPREMNVTAQLSVNASGRRVRDESQRGRTPVKPLLVCLMGCDQRFGRVPAESRAS